MARNTKKLWAILLVVVMLTGMMPEFIVNAAAVTELRMDPRVNAGSITPWSKVTPAPGVTYESTGTGWSANSGLTNSVGEQKTLYNANEGSSVKFEPNASGDTLAPGWYDVSFWNPKTAGTRNFNATVFANGVTQLDDVEQPLGTASSWSKVGRFYFAGTQGEYFQLAVSGSGTGMARVGDVKFAWSADQGGELTSPPPSSEPSPAEPSEAPSSVPFAGWSEDFTGQTAAGSGFASGTNGGPVEFDIAERSAGNNALKAWMADDKTMTQLNGPSVKDKNNGNKVYGENMVITAKFKIEKQPDKVGTTTDTQFIIRSADNKVISHFSFQSISEDKLAVGYRYGAGSTAVKPVDTKMELNKDEWYQLLMGLNSLTGTYDFYFLDESGEIVLRTDGRPAAEENVAVRYDTAQTGGIADVAYFQVNNFLPGTVMWFDDFKIANDPDYHFPDLSQLPSPEPSDKPSAEPSSLPSAEPFAGWREDFTGQTATGTGFTSPGDVEIAIAERAPGNSALRASLEKGRIKTNMDSPSLRAKNNGNKVFGENIVISTDFMIEKQTVSSQSKDSQFIIRSADNKVIAHFSLQSLSATEIGVGYRYGADSTAVGPTSSKIVLEKGVWYQLLIGVNSRLGTYDFYFLDDSGNVVFRTDNTPAAEEGLPVRYDVSTTGGIADVDYFQVNNFLDDSVLWFDDFYIANDPNYIFPDLETLPTPSPRPTFPPAGAPVFTVLDDVDKFEQIVPDTVRDSDMGGSATGGSLHLYAHSDQVTGVFHLVDVPTGIYEVYYKVPLVHSSNTDKMTLDIVDSVGKTGSGIYDTKSIEDLPGHTDNISTQGIKTQSWIKLDGQYTFYPQIPGTLTAGKVKGATGAVRYEAVTLIKVGDTAEIPLAYEVQISGKNKPGAELTGTYKFADNNGNTESGSVYKWYTKAAENAPWSVAASGTTTAAEGAAYTIKETDKFIKFEITPKSNASETGLQTGLAAGCELAVYDEQPPAANNVVITGEPQQGAKLSASYEFSDVNGDLEGDTAYKWLLGDGPETPLGDWKVLEEGTAKAGTPIEFTVPVTVPDGKYIRIAITPKNDDPALEKGETVYSNLIGPFQNTAIKPKAINLTFGGQAVNANGLNGLAIDGEAKADYIYTYALGLPENKIQTKYQWYSADLQTGPFTPIAGATKETYIPTQADSGKYIRFSVTPVSEDGVEGETVYSDSYIVKWKLSFYDEFEYDAANADMAPFTDKWTSDRSQRTLGEPIPIEQMRIPENTSVSEGSMKITTRKEHLDKYKEDHTWTTGNVMTKETWGPYGYYESRLKFAAATGLNQAFWTITRGDTTIEAGFLELDFLEGHYPYELTNSIHRYDIENGSQKRFAKSIKSYPFGRPGTETLADNFNILGGYLKPNDSLYAWNAEENQDTYQIYFNNNLLRSTESVQYVPSPGRIMFSIAVFPGWCGILNDQADGSVFEMDYVRFYEEIGVTQSGTATYDIANTELQSAVAMANQILQNAVIGNAAGNYTQQAKAELQNAVAKANAVTDNAKKAAAANELNQAVKEFQKKQIGDRTALQAKIAQAEALLKATSSGDAYGQCPANYIRVLNGQMDVAKQLVAGTPTQGQLDSSANSLQIAIDNVIAKKAEGKTVTSDNQMIDIASIIAVGPGELTFEPSASKAQLILPDEFGYDMTLHFKNNKGKSVSITIPEGTRVLSGNSAVFEWLNPQISGKSVSGAFSTGNFATDKLIRIEVTRGTSENLNRLNGSALSEFDAVIETDSFDAANAGYSGSGAYTAKYDGSGISVLYSSQLGSFAISSDSSEQPDDNDNNNNNNNNNNQSQTNPGGAPGGMVIPGGTNSNKPSVNFKDISGHWAEKEIRELAQAGIINGRSETQYAPEENVSRAEFAALIRRALKINPQLYKGGFSDVSEGDWYANEIQAIADAGIMSGDTNGAFRPNDTITREEMAKVIVNAYKVMTGADNIIGADVSFNDSQSISEWAQDYVKQAVSLNLMNGMGDGIFVPQGYATRAQSAVVIYRIWN